MNTYGPYECDDDLLLYGEIMEECRADHRDETTTGEFYRDIYARLYELRDDESGAS